MNTVLSTMTMALMFAAVVDAQATLTGKWEGKTRNGFEILLDLTATTTSLTGTLTRNGQATTITDGKVATNGFSFKAAINDQTEGFTGELGDDEIRLWLDRQGPASAAVLKRIKN
jgi:hypothetical protein